MYRVFVVKKPSDNYLQTNPVLVSKCCSEAGCLGWCASGGLGVSIWACWRWQLVTRDWD